VKEQEKERAAMSIKFVAGKLVKAVIAVLLSVCFSFEPNALAAQPATATVSTQTAWRRLETKEDNFSIMLPAQPEVAAHGNYILGANGEFIDEERIATAYHNGVVYIIRIYTTSNPRRMLSKYPSIIRLSDAEESSVQVGSLEGKQYLKRRERYVHFIRLFPTKKRLYVLEAAARDEGNANIRRFISSLTLGDASTATVATGEKSDPATARVDNGQVQPLPIAPGLEPLSDKEVTLPAAIIYKPQPRYSARAKQLGVSGTLKYRVLLSPSGEVTDIKVTQGLGGGLSDTTVQTVKSIKFLPAEKDGRLVPQYVVIAYNFELR
jgi:TonB family protein